MVSRCGLCCRGGNFFSLVFLRWTIAIPIVIYFSLFFVNYSKRMPLKSLESLEDAVKNTGEALQLQSISFDDEPRSSSTGATSSGGRVKNSKKKYKHLGIDQRDEKLIEEVEKLENLQEPKDLLTEIFQRADTDENQLLDIRELAKWIHAKIKEHVNRAMTDNIGLFTAIDNNPRNGEVSWDEYHAHFLKTHGFSEEYINSHNKRHPELSRTLKESIMRDRARWAEAARNDPERLALDEFLAFTHPESSHRALLQMVEDLFEKFDRDGDEQLTEDEFAGLPSDGVGLDLGDDHEKPIPGSDDRRKEFKHLIDKNKDGRADRVELLMYIDPRNPRHAIQEAQQLIALSDANEDGNLSLPEILNKIDLFLGSKMVDTEKSFHDEFR
ncbi:45 kDa calcium-binding protein [Neodiprion fabricii]|uniref:45 kDa calcium-binding protein n=1 Tax=Neodiprion fabricii TaxID=2872261 RepID=UPI001ED904F2|nr:45 kDa calcium-binding protein [Neodiprion fabricii]